MAAATLSRSQGGLAGLPQPAPTSDGGDQSPIFYTLDTPGIAGAPTVLQKDRAGSIDSNGGRRFHRASSLPADATPSAKHPSGKLDMELNPFEQSFGAKPGESSGGAAAAAAAARRRARSQSPRSARGTPVLASRGVMASPTAGAPGSFGGWSFGAPGQLSTSDLLGAAGFDPASMRTGLTPQIGGATWQPDTPGTAAFIATLTNQTPGIATTMPQNGLAIGAHAAHPGAPNGGGGPNHFDMNFARHMGGPGALPVGGQPFARQPMPRPLPPGFSVPATTLGSVAAPALGVAGLDPSNPLYLLSQSVAAAHELKGVGDDDVMAAAALSTIASSPRPTYVAKANAVPTTVGPAQVIANGPSGGIPVPLPSDMVVGATEPRNGRAVMQTRHSTSSSNASPPLATVTGGRKRKSAAANVDGDDGAKPAPRGRGAKKQRAAAAAAAAAVPVTIEAEEAAEDMDDFDEHDEDDDGASVTGGGGGRAKGGRRGKKGAGANADDGDDKRRSFLERNRQAALKCRQRKKAWLQELQYKVELLTADNETLQSTTNLLREEIAALRAVLVAHKDCPVDRSQAGSATVGALLSQAPTQQQQAVAFA